MKANTCLKLVNFSTTRTKPLKQKFGTKCQNTTLLQPNCDMTKQHQECSCIDMYDHIQFLKKLTLDDSMIKDVNITGMFVLITKTDNCTANDNIISCQKSLTYKDNYTPYTSVVCKNTIDKVPFMLEKLQVLLHTVF